MKIQKFNSLFDLLQAFPTEESCIKFLEKVRWSQGIISPFDPQSKVYNFANGKYRCKNTGKNFNVKTMTIFHDTKSPLRKWFVAIYLLSANKKGISSIQLSKEIDVTQKTAWFMLQRIRESLFHENQSMLDNEVELDETFVGGKNKNRHYNKRVKNSQGRSYIDKTPVLGMLERHGKLVCRVMTNTSYKQINIYVIKSVKRTATLFTDEWGGYKTVRRLYKNFMIDHGKGQYVNGNVYTNTIEGFWSILKRGIIGIYHYTSRKHLQLYVNEFVFRYNTRNVNNYDRFIQLLNNINYHKTYKQFTYAKK